jgi:hypothetical protein
MVDSQEGITNPWTSQQCAGVRPGNPPVSIEIPPMPGARFLKISFFLRFFHRVFHQEFEPLCPVVFAHHFSDFAIKRGHAVLFFKKPVMGCFEP